MLVCMFVFWRCNAARNLTVMGVAVGYGVWAMVCSHINGLKMICRCSTEGNPALGVAVVSGDSMEASTGNIVLSTGSAFNNGGTILLSAGISSTGKGGEVKVTSGKSINSSGGSVKLLSGRSVGVCIRMTLRNPGVVLDKRRYARV